MIGYRHAASDVAARATSEMAMRSATSESALAAGSAVDDDGGLTQYPGGKNGEGIWQRLISMMPPHRVYIEAFLGSGAILRRKKAAADNVGIDVDAGVIATHAARRCVGVEFICADAREYLQQRQWQGDELIYCDPPYLGSARSRVQRSIYRCELMEDEDHAALIRILTTIPAMIMVSGYRSRLYDAMLEGWRRVDYQAQTRGGLKPESVWLNFPEPRALHDYRFLGKDYHDRCRIGRKIGRWKRRLAAMPVLERAAVLDAMGRMDT